LLISHSLFGSDVRNEGLNIGGLLSNHNFLLFQVLSQNLDLTLSLLKGGQTTCQTNDRIVQELALEVEELHVLLEEVQEILGRRIVLPLVDIQEVVGILLNRLVDHDEVINDLGLELFRQIHIVDEVGRHCLQSILRPWEEPVYVGVVDQAWERSGSHLECFTGW
jgi:hypothetical protein